MTAASSAGEEAQTRAGTWVPVCPSSAVQPGELRLVDTGKGEIVVANVDGEFFAVDAICTHALGYLDEGEIQGYRLLCPLHDGCFDVRTGAVVSGPPEEPLAVYEISVDDGTIQVRVPD